MFLEPKPTQASTSSSPPIETKRTHRKLRRLQLAQITHPPTNNRSLDPKNLHPRRHNAPRHSTILLTRLLDDNNRASLGRVCSGKVPRIIYPVLTWREAMVLGVVSCDCGRRAAFGEKLECCCWCCDLGGFVSSDYRGEGGCFMSVRFSFVGGWRVVFRRSDMDLAS
jgi:hypothetical protein